MNQPVNSELESVQREERMPLVDISPFTQIDFPGRLSCIFWYAGCNMRCAYCYNPQIVRGRGTMPFADAERFLLKRRGLLDGVVFSGGECTLNPNLIQHARRVKELGFQLKIDTNGLRPQVVQQLLDEDLIDFLSLDYKAPPQKFKEVCGRSDFENFSTSLDLLISSKIPFEVRTTLHSQLMNKEDIAAIFSDLQQRAYQGNYHLQRALPRVTTLKPLAEPDQYKFALDELQSKSIKVSWR